MDAELFFKEYKRMCDSVTDCKHCPLGEYFLPLYSDGYSCSHYCFDNPHYAANMVEQWSKEHPRKTRMQDFLEKFPNALLTGEMETPTSCCKHLGYIKECIPGRSCVECWKQPVED